MVNIDRTAHIAQPLLDMLGDLQILPGVSAGHLNVDGRQRPEIQNLSDDIGRLKVENRVGIGFMKNLTQFLAVRVGRRMTFLERNQDLAVIVCHERSVAKREIIVAGRQTNIVEDQSQIVGLDDFPNGVFHRRKSLLRGFDAHAGPRAHMKRQLSGIDLREVVLTDKGEQNPGDHEHPGDHGHCQNPAPDDDVQEPR